MPLIDRLLPARRPKGLEPVIACRTGGPGLRTAAVAGVIPRLPAGAPSAGGRRSISRRSRRRRQPGDVPPDAIDLRGIALDENRSSTSHRPASASRRRSSGERSSRAAARPRALPHRRAARAARCAHHRRARARRRRRPRRSAGGSPSPPARHCVRLGQRRGMHDDVELAVDAPDVLAEEAHVSLDAELRGLPPQRLLERLLAEQRRAGEHELDVGNSPNSRAAACRNTSWPFHGAIRPTSPTRGAPPWGDRASASARRFIPYEIVTS